MIQKIYKFIMQNGIISPQDRIVAGVSGGADSVCLFLILEELRKSIDFELEVIHVEHGIRGTESQADADFTQKLCEKYGVRCIVSHVNVPEYATKHGLGDEEAARILRYNIFSEYAKKQNAKIAIAHHQEDNAETILFQMVRGSGLHGVTGIKPIRYDDEGVCYIRPLLCVKRKEIEAFLEVRNQSYCMDSTNLDIEYDRNAIRHNIIPELEKINQKAVEHINNTAERLKAVESYIEQQTEIAIEDVVKIEAVKNSQKKYVADIGKLNALHEAIRDECILEIIGMAAGRKKDIAAVHVRQIVELCAGQSGKRINLPYQVIAYREYNNLVVLKQDESQAFLEQKFEVSYEKLEETRKTREEYIINIPDGSGYFSFKVTKFDGDLKKIPQKPYTKWLCYDKIKSGFLIRKRESGDYYVSDIYGHKKKLKDFFINEKIPTTMRDDIWLLAKDKEIAIIFGKRISENYKVDNDTKEILEVHYSGGYRDGFFKRV